MLALEGQNGAWLGTYSKHTPLEFNWPYSIRIFVIAIFGTEMSRALINLRSADKAGALQYSKPIRSVFSSYSQLRVHRRFHFAPHQHKEFELILVIRGRYQCWVNGVGYTLSKNEALLLQPGEWHEDICPPNLEYVALRFILADHDGPRDQLRFFRNELPPDHRVTSLTSKIYLPLLKRISAESQNRDVISGRMQDVLTEELFWLLVRAFDPSSLASWLIPETPQEEFLVRLLACFRQNIHGSLSVTELAQILKVSPRTLRLRCASLLNLSPARAFLQAKINRAQEFLQQSEMTVKEVSYRLGFSNPYHFSRVYKKIVGHTPSERIQKQELEEHRAWIRDLP